MAVTTVYEPADLGMEMDAVLRYAERKAHELGYGIESMFVSFPGDAPGAATRHLRYANGGWYEVTLAEAGDE